MACNENIIKNMANEVTRNCQVEHITVEPEFVVYLIELMLLNPKYGKLFSKTLNRNSLEYFVNVCGAMIIRGGTSLNTFKVQFIMRRNYGSIYSLTSAYQKNIDDSIRPLLTEILAFEPKPNDEAETKKIYRKICIYNSMYSGLGNPAIIVNLKESMAALESVFNKKDCHEFCMMSHSERSHRLHELMCLTSGVRLFNRDCKRGGEMIPDLPTELTDAGKGCLSTLSHGMVQCMQRVNTLTSAVEDSLSTDEETGNVIVSLVPDTPLTLENYHQAFELLIFNRQYEIYTRQLLQDVHSMVETSKRLVQKYNTALQDIHATVKFKTAVPVQTVFPLFIRLWEIWRSMQHTMFLVSTVNRLMSILQTINEHTKIPYPTIELMLQNKKTATTDLGTVSVADLALLARDLLGQESDGDSDDSEYTATATLVPTARVSAVPQEITFSTAEMITRNVSFLGFCTMCLNVGALVPSDLKLGFIKHRGMRYAFCNIKMAADFKKDPERYVNEVLEYARNNPHVINLLNMKKAVKNVSDNENLVERYDKKVQVLDKDIQTEAHPVDSNIDRNYTWNLWEWKRRACKWADIVNCKTHSTQTHYSHMRSEIHCQTVEPCDKKLQTKKETGMNTSTCNYFLWGLRGQLGGNQHMVDLVPPHLGEKAKAKSFTQCTWPCVGDTEAKPQRDSDESSYSDFGSSEDEIIGPFYKVQSGVLKS